MIYLVKEKALPLSLYSSPKNNNNGPFNGKIQLRKWLGVGKS